jgi:hypothetical protein
MLYIAPHACRKKKKFAVSTFYWQQPLSSARVPATHLGRVLPLFLLHVFTSHMVVAV